MKFINLITVSALALAAIPAGAETVLLEEDFNGDYSKSFPYLYNADQLEPHKAIASLFKSTNGGDNMPWWVLRDSSTSTDRFMGSHSYYTTPGTSNDWLISIPLTIPSEGFVLSFDAQSAPVRSADKLSDLALYITDELLDPAKGVPDVETYLFESIPYGKDINNCEDDWTRYQYSLDAYAGKTVFVNFVNQNYDNDILCIDNIKIARADVAQISISKTDPYTAKTSYPISFTVKPIDGAKITNWKIVATAVTDGIETPIETFSGATMDQLEVKCEVNAPLTPGKASDIRFSFTCAEQSWEQAAQATVTCLAFEAPHRVFFEETTSFHCGNCPLGMYTVESMHEDPDMADRFVPVSVHISGLGYDPLATAVNYTPLTPTNAAPLVYIERSSDYDGFIPAYDGNYDPTNEKSFAYRIKALADQPSFIDLKVAGEWVIQDADTTAIKCKATVRPALDLTKSDYRVAFILTENNVGLDYNPYWLQTNYLSGADAESHYGGWADLSDPAYNVRYHDVARAISAYQGHRNSLPEDMEMNKDYTFEYTLPIPNTLKKEGAAMVADAIQRQFCELSAIVIDFSTGKVVNAARTPMSDKATDRFTVADLVKQLGGVENVNIDTEADVIGTEYYDLSGRRVAEPSTGLYLRRDFLSNGAIRTSKVVR